MVNLKTGTLLAPTLAALALIGSIAAADANATAPADLPSKVEIISIRTGASPHNYTLDDRNRNAIADLAAHAGTPDTTKPTPADLGMTSEWLKQNAEAAFRETRDPSLFPNPSPRLHDAFVDAFEDPSMVQNWLATRNGNTRQAANDDFARMTVVISWPDGRTLRATSSAPAVAQIPWLVSPSTGETYRADIGKAVYELLKLGTANLHGFSNRSLVSTYAHWIWWQQDSRRKFGTIAAEDTLGQQLAPLRALYSINSMAVGPSLFDDAYDRNSLDVRMRDSSLPANGWIAMTAWMTDGGRVGDLNEAIAASQRYEKFAYNIPWIQQFLKDHADWNAYLRVVQNRSVSQLFENGFLLNVGKCAGPSLAAKVRQVILQAALFQMEGPANDYAMVVALPDGTLLVSDSHGPLFDQLLADKEKSGLILVRCGS